MLSNQYRLHSVESCVCVVADMEVAWNEVFVTCCQYHLHLFLGEMKVTEIPMGR
jgi:hypothetical protein